VIEGAALLKIRTLRWLIVSTTAMAFAAGGYNAWLIDFLERDKGNEQGRGDHAALGGDDRCGRGNPRRRPLGGSRSAHRDRRTIVDHRDRHDGDDAVRGGGGSLLPPGPLLYVAGFATMFFISWYHAPMAVSVDDLAPPERAVAAQAS